MSQHNELVEVIAHGEDGTPRLSVHVATWPDRQPPRPPLVTWLDGTRYSYMPASTARRFAAALVRAAIQAETEG